MPSKVRNEVRNEDNYFSWKGLSLQKECTCELPTVEAEEEPRNPYAHILLLFLLLLQS